MIFIDPPCSSGVSNPFYPTGVLRVRPVQAQRPTGDPVADPGDEGSGPVGGPQRSRESPHHGVAKTGPDWTETHHKSLRQLLLGTGPSAFGHQRVFAFI